MWLNRLQVATRNVTWSLNVNSTFTTLCKKNACSTATEEESAVESSERQIRTLRAALVLVKHMYTQDKAFACLMKYKKYFLTRMTRMSNSFYFVLLVNCNYWETIKEKLEQMCSK